MALIAIVGLTAANSGFFLFPVWFNMRWYRPAPKVVVMFYRTSRPATPAQVTLVAIIVACLAIKAFANWLGVTFSTSASVLIVTGVAGAGAYFHCRESLQNWTSFTSFRSLWPIWSISAWLAWAEVLHDLALVKAQDITYDGIPWWGTAWCSFGGAALMLGLRAWQFQRDNAQI